MDKEKEKNKLSLKKLHKNTLKKFLSSNDSSSTGKDDSEKKKSKKLSKKKLALQQQQQQQQQLQIKQQQQHQIQLQQQQQQLQKTLKLNQDDDDDEDDDDDDEDNSSDEEAATTPTATLPKDLYINTVNKMRIEYSKPIQFTPFEKAMQNAHDDSSHLIFIIYCVDWFFESRQLVSNVEQVLSKDKNILYYFVNQYDKEYKGGDIPGVPIISIYYRQKPFKIKRDTLDYDWEDEERIKGSPTASQLKQLVSICKQSIESYHPDENFEITIEF
ncbi:hypothetical protein DICPUDRAFT_156959 [Dictyostelium purpureum]|uniref:Thioredoxin domain-containing protein n=1 Tax=Dictyostelium purpureum TaxID=5786 RepID=F0ZXW4_DICPU|nr:uncharacterized protein DICPUDRAFT_156959 [Dictyostelium purpureum]EGC31220.1 hypothetical protein DICPUDRAFT_156959 [Dictyostelium purpureum]|eukprot:XP_003292250.1 hypothetical protein DICPUDRAFT_156959 [Dictyostelium purpureum]